MIKYIVSLLFLPLLSGCTGFGQLSFSGPAWLNFIAPLEGNVIVSFVNETPYKISTYWGTYNDLDARHGVTVAKVELAGGGQTATADFVTTPTTRKLDVAGPFLRRAAEIGIPPNTDPDLIPDTVTFTDDAGTIIGTAPPGQFLLGVDYSSNSFVEIHFKQVPGTTDQFTIEAIATQLQ